MLFEILASFTPSNYRLKGEEEKSIILNIRELCVQKELRIFLNFKNAWLVLIVEKC